MSAPRLVVVGHCTHNSAKFLAVFQPALPPGTIVHLYYDVNHQSGHSSVPCLSADPYSLAMFEVMDLPSSFDGSSMNYSIDSEIQKYNHTFRRSLKLLPSGRALRVALVSCNGVYRIKDKARRFLLWQELA